MNLKRMVCASTLVAGVGLAGLFGAGTAGAQPGQPCGRQDAPACQSGPGPQNNGPGPQNNGPVDWQRRDINQARQDHQPFQYNGQQVRPERAGNGDGWGFWFLGQWIKL